jgi:hypothetical protein
VAVWVVVLLITNLVTLGALVALWRNRNPEPEPGGPDETFTAARPAGLTGRSRRLISVEVLNPIELVGSRGRVAGLAGSLAPGIARRVVYDQVLKTLRRELADKQVIADVRLHHLRPAPAPKAARTPALEAEPAVELVDQAEVIDLEPVEETHFLEVDETELH